MDYLYESLILLYPLYFTHMMIQIIMILKNIAYVFEIGMHFFLLLNYRY